MNMGDFAMFAFGESVAMEGLRSPQDYSRSARRSKFSGVPTVLFAMNYRCCGRQQFHFIFSDL